MSGKKTDRMKLPRQVCMDPEIGREIREQAVRDCRDIEDHMRWCLMAGMIVWRLNALVKPSILNFHHFSSPELTPPCGPEPAPTGGGPEAPIQGVPSESRGAR